MTDVLVMKRSSLVLPENFVPMDNEEMCYVEGGGISRDVFAIGIDLAIVGLSLICGVIAAFQSYHTLGRIGGGLVRDMLKKPAMEALKALIKGAGPALGFAVTGAVLSATNEVLNILFDFSIGGLVARIIDRADGNYNGICFG
jgi:hypothetical protein